MTIYSFSSTSDPFTRHSPDRPPSPPSSQEDSLIEVWCEQHQIDHYPTSSQKLEYRRFLSQVNQDELFDSAFQELLNKKKLSITVGRGLRTWCLSTENEPPEEHRNMVQKHHLTHMFSKNYTVMNDRDFMNNLVSKIRRFGVEVTASYMVQSYPEDQEDATYLNNMTLQVTKADTDAYNRYIKSINSILNSEIFSMYD